MTHALASIEARDRIADLIHHYAYAVRHRTIDELHDLFCVEAEFVVRERSMGGASELTTRSHVVGRTDILAYIRRSSATMALCPLIHNLLIRVDGTRADSTCIMENRTWPAIPGLIGEYSDDFVFDGQWRFARRTYTMFLD